MADSKLLQSLFEGNDGETNPHKTGLPINQITEKIIGCSYTVSNALGCGFLEKVYENALTHELKKTGLKVFQQYPIKVYYDEIIVGEYIADLVVENCVIIELKALGGLEQSHLSQCLNYLKATEFKICLLINFGRPKIEIRRIAL